MAMARMRRACLASAVRAASARNCEILRSWRVISIADMMPAPRIIDGLHRVTFADGWESHRSQVLRRLVLASRSASSTVIACNRHRSSRRAPELSPSKKARFIAERLTGGLFDMPAKESDSRLPRQHFSPETAQSSQYTAPPRIRDCERFRLRHGLYPNRKRPLP